MKKIQLSGNLDENVARHHVGVGIEAVNDGSLEDGCWDLQMLTADNWLGTDHGDGIAIDSVTYEGDMARCDVTITDYDYVLKRSCAWTLSIEIDRRFVVDEAA